VSSFKLFLRLAAWPALLLLAGCNPKGRVEAARVTTEAFHQRYIEKNYAAMYDFSGPAVRKSSPQPDFIKYENDVRTKLGELKSADLVGYNILYLLTGPRVRIDYHCKYEKGEATESFEINFKDGKPVIDGYRLDSPVLDKK
jgi:hypothetical protein